MKIKLFLFVIILILPMAGSADFAQNNYCHTYANLSTKINFVQVDASDKCALKDEAEIENNQIENTGRINSLNDKIISDDRLG